MSLPPDWFDRSARHAAKRLKEFENVPVQSQPEVVVEAPAVLCQSCSGTGWKVVPSYSHGYPGEEYVECSDCDLQARDKARSAELHKFYAERRKPIEEYKP